MKRNIFVIACLSLLLSSCSNSNIVDPKKYDISSIHFFKAAPPKKWENRVYPLALTYGYLVLKDNCLYLTNKKDSDKNLIILYWPWDYSLKETKAGIHIMDGKQIVTAKVGSYVNFGGAGSGFKNSSFKLKQKYKACNNINVVGHWAVSPNFNRPIGFDPSKIRSSLQRFMKN